MNLQQLEYVLAVDEHRHFVKAAAACHVTQPTLSMMIQKLEEELECKIFDRSKQPVVPTPVGELIVEQARKILLEVSQMHDLLRRQKVLTHGYAARGYHSHAGPLPGASFYQSLSGKVSGRSTFGVGACHVVNR